MPSDTIIRCDNLSIGDIVKYNLIPEFQYLSAPDLRWFELRPGYEHLTMPQFMGESYSDWSVVKLGFTAIEACHALGMPVVMVSWSSPWHPTVSSARQGTQVRIDLSGYDYIEREAAIERMQALAGNSIEPDANDSDVYIMYVEEATFVAFAMRRKDIFELARYFALASRREHRNPIYDYGSLPPGHGYGEYKRDYTRRSDNYWVAPVEQLEADYQEAIREERFIETKAPDSGSIKTGSIDDQRDIEWL